MAAKKKAGATAQVTKGEIDVIDLRTGTATLWLLGDTPFYCNRMAEKAKRELLLPRGTLTRSQRATKLKHAPLSEFRDSPYLRRLSMAEPAWLSEWSGKDTPPTLLQMIGAAPKKAVATAALDMPSGVAKAQINRLVSAPDEYVSLWGIPRLDMSVVRMANQTRTPDIRTRARLDRWAMRIRLRWLEPMLNQQKVGQLLIAAGLMCGLGDWRQEKGSGSFGLFHLVDENDDDLKEVIETGGFQQQLDALRDPVCANSESEDLLNWYREELERRGVNPEDERPEDVEVEETEALDPEVAKFGAAEEVLDAPRKRVRRLPIQNGEETP